jgi:hypothetical protein
MLRSLLLVSVVLGAGAFQTSTPAAPSYDATFTLDADGAVYSGTTTFAIDAKGAVTGKMALTQPTEVNAALGGVVKDGTWNVAYDYAIPAQNCTGSLTGTGKVPKDMKVITGRVTIGGGCTQEAMTATFSFTRRDK